MINIKLFYSNDYIVKVNAIGHANRKPETQEDAVCAAVSVLMINTYNALEKLASASLESETDKNTGLFNFEIKTQPNEKTQLLMESLKLGLEDIQDGKYVSLEIVR